MRFQIFDERIIINTHLNKQHLNIIQHTGNHYESKIKRLIHSINYPFNGTFICH